VDECKALTLGRDLRGQTSASFTMRTIYQRCLLGRGLHSVTFRLNASALCGIGCAFRGCLGDFEGRY